MSDCFVKLALTGEISTKGYLLLKISQPYGLSLEDIKHEAIVLYCDTSGISQSDLNSQSVTVNCNLEFRDNEGDIIIVKTNLDLRNFSAALPSSHCGKVFAYVSTTIPGDSTKERTASTSVNTQTEQKVEPKNSDDQKIINAISDIFSIAAVSMKAGITAAMTEKNLESDFVQKAANEAVNSHKVSKESLKEAKRLTKESYKMLHRAMKHHVSRPVSHADTVKNALELNDKCCTRSKINDCKTTTVNNDTTKDEGEIFTKEESVKNACTVPPFIHGRHTCDQCLTTPIIGTRFRALNLPDYDLCTSCHRNYKGTDIVFEEAKLERDIPFQDRWNRKRAMNEGHLKPRVIRSHYQRGCRLSSAKMTSSSAAPTASLSPAVGSETFVVGQDDLPLANGEPSVLPVSTGPDDLPLDNETSVLPVPTGPDDLALEEAIRRSLNDVVVSNESAEKKNFAQPEQVDIPVDTANVVGTSSDVSMAETQKIVVEPEVVVCAESVPDEAISIQNDTSFATQAVGAGDVAEFVGQTLDRMSEAIDDLNVDMIDKGDLIFEDSNFVEDNVASEYDSDDDSSGSKIVDGEEDASSTSSWSVVVEKEPESLEDGGLGRATEALGSAMFQSDMMRSVEDTSTALSSVTSVPTVTPSIVEPTGSVSTVQLQHWSAQLEQLHELGFMNDTASIDILESLCAANIGVDSIEEVTVQHVVQKLMGD